jgi:spiro-SPASM protein
MKNIAVVNALSFEAAVEPLADGRSSLDRAIAFGRALPGVEDLVVLLTKAGRAPSGTRGDARTHWVQGELLQALKKHSAGFEDIFYFHADCPLLDRTISERMHASHRKYFADYTYADGYPVGLAPEILRSDLVGRLQTLCDRRKASLNGPVLRDTLFELIKLDINSFDIETELAPRDQRLLRVSLTMDTKRNRLLVARLMEAGGNDAESITLILENTPRLQRTLPAFFPVQIVERCPQTCSYCPYPKLGGNILEKTGFMPADKFTSLAEKISAFCGDAVIDVSLWGEPALHPEIARIAAAALRTPGIRLVIETSGIGWKDDELYGIAQLPKPPTWIVSLDARSEQVYRGVRGEGFAEAQKTTQKLMEIFPDSVYVQAVRMKENEEDLEGFYSAWKGKTEKVIVQKYDSFCGVLPDRKVSDLSPLRRFPCWHLRRDMPVLMDGTVPMCREDLESKNVLGNLFTEELSKIWEKGEALDQRHIALDYPRMCACCDEWYTYNF